MIYFGQARAERKHLKAIEHFLGKRIRYGRDILPEKILTRLQEARLMAKEALGWGASGERLTDARSAPKAEKARARTRKIGSIGARLG